MPLFELRRILPILEIVDRRLTRFRPVRWQRKSRWKRRYICSPHRQMWVKITPCLNRRRRWHKAPRLTKEGWMRFADGVVLFQLCRRFQRLIFWGMPFPQFALWATNMASAPPTEQIGGGRSWSFWSGPDQVDQGGPRWTSKTRKIRQNRKSTSFRERSA